MTRGISLKQELVDIQVPRVPTWNFRNVENGIDGAE